MGYLIQNFILGIGGILRWIFYQLLNVPLNDKYPKNISHFLDDDAIKDNGGLTSQNKNFISFFIFLFLFIVLAEKCF